MLLQTLTAHCSVAHIAVDQAAHSLPRLAPVVASDFRMPAHRRALVQVQGGQALVRVAAPLEAAKAGTAVALHPQCLSGPLPVSLHDLMVSLIARSFLALPSFAVVSR